MGRWSVAWNNPHAQPPHGGLRELCVVHTQGSTQHTPPLITSVMATAPSGYGIHWRGERTMPGGETDLPVTWVFDCWLCE